MSKSAQQWFYLDESQLIKLVGQDTYPSANNAWDRFIQIKEAGGTPKVFYSEHNDFTVLDDNEPDVMRRIMSIEQSAKRFPS